jgi:hypothetical protein
MAYTTIDNPGLFFNTLLYAGNGSTQSITGVGFQPDWTWIKSRGDTSNHRIYDGVRGATKVIYSNLTNVEGTDTNGLTSFDSDGFSLGTEGQSNGNGVNFASWNWLAGGSTASNGDGSITSTVSANTTAGFSIVSYTGNSGTVSTVGHGLGTTPDLIIFKGRSIAQGWIVWHQEFNARSRLVLNGTNAVSTTQTNFMNDTLPSSSVFTIGNDADTNNGTDTYIAYCFAEKKGYSKFGSYTGNGNAEGTFVHTGFRPAFFMWKRTDATTGWGMIDNKRDTINVMGKQLFPNSSSAEASYTILDFTSNGIKMRNTFSDTNASGGSFIYMAFAENPFVTEGTKAAGTAR